MQGKILVGEDPWYVNFAGPSMIQELAASVRYRDARRQVDYLAGQSSHQRYVGTPRHAKHRGQRIGGVPIR